MEKIKSSIAKTLESVKVFYSLYHEVQSNGYNRYIVRYKINNKDWITKKFNDEQKARDQLKKIFPNYPNVGKEEITPSATFGLSNAELHSLVGLLEQKKGKLNELITYADKHWYPCGLFEKRTIASMEDEYFNRMLTLGRRAATIYNIRYVINKFAEYSKSKFLSDFTTENLQKFYDVQGVNALEYYKRINPLFNYCVKMQYMPRNPNIGVSINNIPPKKAMYSTIMKLDAVRAAMWYAEMKFPAKITAIFAIMFFCGIRPYEVNFKRYGKKTKLANHNKSQSDSLMWKDIDFKRRVIRVQKEVSKCSREALLTHLPDNLWAWLERVPLKERVERVGVSLGVFRKYHLRIEKFLKSIGFKDTAEDEIYKLTNFMGKDTDRHTFCTMAALNPNIGPHRALEIARHSKDIDLKSQTHKKDRQCSGLYSSGHIQS